VARATRSFRLTLSPAGIDLLIDVHCRMIRTTRCLLSWGATLHIAMRHLETLPTGQIATALARLPTCRLTGPQAHFLGAPNGLADIAGAIAENVHRCDPDAAVPLLGDIYIVALQHALLAPAQSLVAAHARIAGMATAN
jgi:hypothetical protein